MTHDEIEQRETIEGYVRGRLTETERQAFEEHYFACDKCFADVQANERFVAGVHYAAESGLLASATEAGRRSPAWSFFNEDWKLWLKPAFALTGALAIVLTALVGWLVFRQIPQLREELALERQGQLKAQQSLQQSLTQTQAELERAREQQSELENQLALARASSVVQAPNRTDPNLPLVMLEATRAGQTATEVSIPTNARSLVLWMDPGLDANYPSFRLIVRTPAGQTIQMVDGLRRNSYGAVLVSVSAERMRSSNYQVRLYGVNKQASTLLSEYQLRVRRR
jgi:hypothetical protein